MKRIFEILLIAVVLALAGGLLWPRTPRDLPTIDTVPDVISPQVDEAENRIVPEPGEPEQIARLFGWRPPAIVSRAVDAAPPEPIVEPEPIRWLVHVGHVVDAADRVLYLFKDTRTGTALSLVQGDERRGWILVEVGEKAFVAEYEGKKYLIDRKD